MRIKLETKGFEEIMDKLQRLGDHVLREAVKDALEASFNEVQPQVDKYQKPHRRSGDMDRGLIKAAEIKELGYDQYGVDVAFKIRDGGWPNRAFHSIYIMHGTPTIRPNEPLRDIVFGNGMKRVLRTTQKNTFYKHIENELRK